MDIKINTHVQQGIIEVVKPEVLAILSVSLCFTTKSQGDFADSFSLFSDFEVRGRGEGKLRGHHPEFPR